MKAGRKTGYMEALKLTRKNKDATFFGNEGKMKIQMQVEWRGSSALTEMHVQVLGFTVNSPQKTARVLTDA